MQKEKKNEMTDHNETDNKKTVSAVAVSQEKAGITGDGDVSGGDMPAGEAAFSVAGVDETMQLGRRLGELLQPGDLLVLSGALGVGKTHFAKGVARGLGVAEEVNSPSYTLINEYQGRLPFYHWDVYRLAEPEEIYELGYEEYFYGSGVTLVEWGDQIAEMLPEDYLEICLSKVSLRPDKADARLISLRAWGVHYAELLKELAKACIY